MSSLHNVTVLGSGVLGGQIAWHSAFRGKSVTVYDIDAEALLRCRANHDRFAAIYRDEVGATADDIAATRSRLAYTTDLTAAAAAADLVIEAVPEIPTVKTAVYTELAPLLSDHALVATNSSTFLPRDFADATGRPDKFCALHFGNGIWAMNFAEIMAHPGTARQTLTEVTEFAIEIGMMPIPVGREQNGYVVNTWTVALSNAAQTLVTNGVSTPQDVDRSFMKFGFHIGPLGMLDQVGLKTAHDILSYWGEHDGDAQMSANAAWIKENLVDRGRLGAQSGQGYYHWPEPEFLRPDFLVVPKISEVPSIVDRIVLS